jgi:hypothetical protein
MLIREWRGENWALLAVRNNNKNNIELNIHRHL